MGGIRTGLDALEFVLAGASAVAVGTALFHDPAAVPRVQRELDEALAARRIAALADAVPFHTVAALNPFLPPPPPEHDDVWAVEHQKFRLTEFERSLAEELNEARRKDIRADIKNIRALIEQVESDRAAHARRLEEYRNSEEFREALTKLVSALRELERRGLLQWDRRKNTYDLHPVVRGYAFDILEESERTDICNLIIDHFQSKPPDRYAEAKTLADVQQSINIFRALVQARRFDEAAELYSGDFAQTLLYSLEAQQEILTLLTPLFPDTFQNVPRGLSASWHHGHLMTDAGLALLAVGRSAEARKVLTEVLRLDVGQGTAHLITAALYNLSIAYQNESHIARSIAALELALELSKAANYTEAVSRLHLGLMSRFYDTSLLERAEAAFNDFRQFPTPTTRSIYRVGDAEENLCKLRFRQGALTAELLAEAEAIAAQGNNRRALRSLYMLQGDLALQRGDTPSAIASFERVIEMTQKVGLPVGAFEARLALAKAKSGEREQAHMVCDRLHESADPPHTLLASSYLEIGDKERARRHALEGYSWAWADGPPYSRHWELERCREVLRALGEAEPVLPAFDPKAVEPVPYEKEIRALIAKLKKEKKSKKDSPS
jgi:tetratricopeptide (TPR) repeat protein